MNQSLSVNEEIDEKMTRYYQLYYRDTLGLPDWSRRVGKRLREENDEFRYLKKLESAIGPVRGRKVLNIGCGTGGFNVVAHRAGAEVHGVELSDDAMAICRLKAQGENIPQDRFVPSPAEKLPYADGEFDVVYAFSVLEHVANIPATIAEMMRVLRPGGSLYVQSPTYLGFYEDHYKIFWPPLLPKALGRAYLRMRGRPPAFIDTINYTTLGSILREMKRYDIDLTWEKRQIIRGAGKKAFLFSCLYKLLGIQPIEIAGIKRGVRQS